MHSGNPPDGSATSVASLGGVPGRAPRELVLLGAGHAHLQVLSHWAKHPLPGVRITLVTPHARQLYSGMVPGFVAGRYTIDACAVALEPLVRAAGISWLQHSVVALDAQAQTLQIDDGSTRPYDCLSVNTGPVQNRGLLEQHLPGARQHGLFVRPIEAFAGLWPQVVEMGSNRLLRFAVIGGGAAGIEMALAIRQRMPRAAVTLLCGPTPAGATYPAPAQQRIGAALRSRRITVIQDSATGITASAVQLASGATLACDVPVIATGAQAPAWLADSGLALDAQGFIAVDDCQRSTSHSQVLAAGDICTRQDRALPRSGVYAVRAGPALARNLQATVQGNALTPHQPPTTSLNLLSCGDGVAIASWGGYSATGRWAWWLKDWIDRRFVNRFRLSADRVQHP